MDKFDEQMKKENAYFQSGYDDKCDTVEDEFPQDEIENDIIGNVLDYSITSSITGLQLESIINSLKTKYFLVPGFQRKFVWTKKQVASLAVSVIKNIPIPPIYVYIDNKTKKQVILDGQQRVTAIFLYIFGLYFSSDNKLENKDKYKRIDFADVAKVKEEMEALQKVIEDTEKETIDTETKKIIIEKKSKRKESPKIKKVADDEVFNKIKVIHCNIKAVEKNEANFS